MRWLTIIAVVALLGYFETDRMVIGVVCVLLSLGFIGYDIDALEKKLTAIKDHSEQIRDGISGRFDTLEQVGTKALKEVEYVASRMQSLEAEVELLREHLVPNRRRPWEA